TTDLQFSARETKSHWSSIRRACRPFVPAGRETISSMPTDLPKTWTSTKRSPIPLSPCRSIPSAPTHTVLKRDIPRRLRTWTTASTSTPGSSAAEEWHRIGSGIPGHLNDTVSEREIDFRRRLLIRPFGHILPEKDSPRTLCDLCHEGC